MATPGFNEEHYLSQKLSSLTSQGETQSDGTAFTTTAQVKEAIEAAGLTPESHYEQFGFKEVIVADDDSTTRLTPNDNFVAEEYIAAKAAQLVASDSATYPTLDEAQEAFLDALDGGNVYNHYLEFGDTEGLNPSNSFDADQYFQDKLTQLQSDSDSFDSNSTVDDVKDAFADAGLSAIEHFELFGSDEGLSATAVATADEVDPLGALPAPASEEGETFTLTTSLDSRTGTDGDDSFSGTIGSSEPTVNAGDAISGGDGEDLLNIISTGATANVVSGLEVDGVETLRVNDTSTANATTVNMAGISGVETVESNGSSNAAVLEFDNLSELVDLTLSNTSGANGAVTLTYRDSAVEGSSDVQEISLSDADASGNTTVAGVETVNVTGSGESTLNLVADEAETVTLSGDGDTTLDLSSATNSSLSSVDASSATGDVALGVDADPRNVSVTGGSGDDIIDTTDGTLTENDSVDGGEGSDTLRYRATTDTAGSGIATSDASISNLETLELQADNSDAGGNNATDFTAVDMDVFTGVSGLLLDSNDDDAANAYTLQNLTAEQAGDVATTLESGGGSDITMALKDGSGSSDAASVDATVQGTNATLTLTDSETNGAIEDLTVAITGNDDMSLTVTNGDFDESLTVTGGNADNTIDATGADITSKTVDFSDAVSDISAAFGDEEQTVTGGSGDDTFNFKTNLDSDDTVDGGEGDDTLRITPNATVAGSATVSNVERLQLEATATATLNFADAEGLNEIDLDASNGGTSVVTLSGLSDISKITAAAEAGTNLDDANGLTLVNAFAGDADSLTLELNTVEDTITTGALSLEGLETLNIDVTGDGDSAAATVDGVTATDATTVTVTDSGYTAANEDIVLGSVGQEGTNGDDEMTSFDSSGATAGINVTLDSLATGASVAMGDGDNTVSLAGSDGSNIAIDLGDGDNELTLNDQDDHEVTFGDVADGSTSEIIFNAGSDDTVVNLGTGAFNLDFTGAAQPTEASGNVINGFSSDDVIDQDAAVDTAFNVLGDQGTTEVVAGTYSGDTMIITPDASVAGSIIGTTPVVSNFTDVTATGAGSLGVFITALLADNGTGGAVETAMVLNDGTNSYLYSFDVANGGDDATNLTLVGTFNDLIIDAANDFT